MKIRIGPYTDWFGPYQLAETLMFWVPEEKDEHGFPHTGIAFTSSANGLLMVA